MKIRGFFPLKRFIYRERSIDIQTARIHMRQRWASSFGMVACVSALICMVSLNAGAQQGEGQASAPAYATAGKASKALPDGGPAPRLADGHPDFSGIWFVGSLGKEDALSVQSAASQGDQALRPFDPKVTPEEQPSFQPWAAEKAKEFGRGPAAGRQQYVLPFSPSLLCSWPGRWSKGRPKIAGRGRRIQH